MTSPANIPEWQRALQLQQHAARSGFEWPHVAQVIAKLREEIIEVETEIANGSHPDRLEDEIGDLLFVALNLARHTHTNPQTALQRANNKFEQRFHAMQTLATQQGRNFQNLSLSEQEALWKQVKG